MPPLPILAGWSNPELFSVVLAGVLTLLVVATRRLRSAPWISGAAIFLAVAAVAAFSTQFNLVGWHGFMHGAPLFRILDGGPLPPEDPLFAGGSLRYPWVEHWLMALLARATGLSAHLLTITIEVGLFGVFLAAGAWLASMVTRDRSEIALAVLFTAFGVSAFHGGLFQGTLLRALPGLTMETRVIPLDKFANISGMPLGYVAMILAAAAGVGLACRPSGARAMALLVAACTLVAAYVHPLSWVGILAFEGIVALVLLPGRDAGDRVRALWLAAAVFVPSLLAFPYLRSIGASESSDGWTGLAPQALVASKSWDAAIFLAPLLLMIYVHREHLRRMLKDGNRALEIVLLVVPAMAAAYLAVRFPGRNEYKFLLFAAPASAVLMALATRALLDRHLLLGVAVVGVILLPGSNALGVRPWFSVMDPCRADGAYLRILDPTADELYEWIAANTPPDSVFLAADLRVPPLGRRGLYIAVDAPWRSRDGWGLPRNQILQWHIRRPDAVMHRRQHLATLVLNADWSRESADRVIAEIRADIPGRPLFVHETNDAAAERLERTPGFVRRFRNQAGSIYEITN